MSDSKYEILIVSHFSGGENKDDNDRLKYIANILGRKYSVNMLTSAFFHTQKKHSFKAKNNFTNFGITYIYEPGYSKNVSLKRFYSHFICGINLRRYLKTMQIKPKIIYCAIPSLSCALASLKYAKNNKIPFIIDIQDLWPEAFKMVFNPPIVADIIYYPIIKIAQYVYKNATEVIAVSKTYSEKAANMRSKEEKCEAIYIGTSFNEFDKIPKLNKIRLEETYYLIYIGTLGHSYDLKCAIDAYEIVKMKLRSGIKIKFWVLGDGPLQYEFEKYSSQKGLDIDFKGRLTYKEMVGYLKAADIAINPIVGSSVASIINKHADYAAAGLPVISTQESIEYKNLLDEFNAGFTCKSGDSAAMAEKICCLLENPQMRINMSENSRKMGELLFNRDRTYCKVEKIIERYIK